MNEHLIARAQEVIRRHDPEHEIHTCPGAVSVTWTESLLAELLVQLAQENDALLYRLQAMQAQIDRLIKES